MPYLKAILVNATDKSNCMLRAKSMECISLVGMAFGKEKFRDDAKQVMEVLMSLQGSQMETDDPTTSYMLQAWARLCKCLGQDFLPYMSVVMPPLLQSAQLKPDVTLHLQIQIMISRTLTMKVWKPLSSGIEELGSRLASWRKRQQNVTCFVAMLMS
ncbi:hypothetical protein ES332_A13G251100v1 [Gossypium tomentosum]|uniref:Interferon-related developmental regulator N-terminal domain-containing protein n=1 Tax=Gossypium tomentosum TaxID=34277 RepID=A0A5D2MSA4_GOSTO|nr:hypothetical protein ES332_A13G251100v1 [Gossypium tomentosum]